MPILKQTFVIFQFKGDWKFQIFSSWIELRGELSSVTACYTNSASYQSRFVHTILINSWVHPRGWVRVNHIIIVSSFFFFFPESSLWKCFPFTLKRKTDVFQFSLRFWRALTKSSVFGGHFLRISVNGRIICGIKLHFQISRACVSEPE